MIVHGPPVLLVHGFASSFERNWREPGWVDLLSDAGREVIGVDLLGHGNADKPHDPAAYEHIEDDVRAALPDEGAVDAIGFSAGARIVLDLASREPHRFNRIVAGGVGANLFAWGSAEHLARAVEHGISEDTPAVGRVFATFAAGAGNDRAALAAFLRRPQQPMTPEQLSTIACPVLVVLGEKDFAGPADPLLEALPDARLVTLPGTDHFATPKDFKFLDAALEFLDAVPA